MRASCLPLLTCVLTCVLAVVACGASPDRSAPIAATAPGSPAGRAYASHAAFDVAALEAPSDGERLQAAARPKAASTGGTPLAEAGSTASPFPREVVYTARLHLVVVSIDDATRSVRRFAEQAGGHLQNATSDSITIRVPAARFEATFDRIADLGEVTDRSIDASDVTEQILDLDIRLANARKTRERLLEHLARSQKIADTLEIERELARVSETIEQIEGRLRSLRSQVAMSTITVVFAARSPIQPRSARPLGLPFPWIEELGDGLVAGAVEPVTRRAGLFDFPPKLEPPADFLRYYTSRDRVEALSAEGLRIKVRRHANQDRGSLAFWQTLARESLVRGRAVTITEERSLDEQRALLRGLREVGGQKQGYLLVLKRSARRVESFEAWGPAEDLETRLEALIASARAM